MTIQVTVNVSSHSGAADTTLREITRDIERIKSFDGATVTVTVEPHRISMISKPRALYEVIEQMLAEADAAVSPHYTAPPRGLPYAIRIEAAMRYFRTASPEFRREAERRSLGVPPRNRQEHMRQNPELFQQFFKTRGPLETAFLRALCLR